MIDEKKLNELDEMIKKAKRIVFFTGAGVSTASGIPDFRGSKGLYKLVPEEIVSHEFFIKHPKEFYQFYFDKMVFEDVLPNKAHLAMASLERMGKVTAVITQNIDTLHQQAGSKCVIPLHGTVEKYICMNCGNTYHLKDISKKGVPHCKKCSGILKPDVVLYNEQLDEKKILQAIEAIYQADLLIVAGTSLVVYPAASFIRYFQGENLVIINLDKTNYDHICKLQINDRVEDVLAKYADINLGE